MILLLVIALMSAFPFTIQPGEYSAPQRFDQVYNLPAKGNVIYYKGRLLAVDMTDGRGQIASDASGLIVVGKIDRTVDNTAQPNDAQLVPYMTGCFPYQNDPDHPVTQHHYGKPVFIKNDITVSASPGVNNVFAGFFLGFFNGDTSKCWVDSRPLPLIAAFFGNNPANNWRLSANPVDGSSVLQLWNQTQQKYQTVQLDGGAGAERLIISA